MCGDLVTLLINTGHTMKESTGHQKKGASLYSLQDDTAFTRRSTTNNSSFNNLFVNLDLIVIGLVTKLVALCFHTQSFNKYLIVPSSHC